MDIIVSPEQLAEMLHLRQHDQITLIEDHDDGTIRVTKITPSQEEGQAT